MVYTAECWYVTQRNLHNGLFPTRRFLHVSGKRRTVTNEDELHLYSRSVVAAWGRSVAAGTESRAAVFRSHPLSAGPRDRGALALALRWEATNSSTPSAQSPVLQKNQALSWLCTHCRQARQRQ